MATAAAKYPGPRLVQQQGSGGGKVVTGANIQIENGEWFKIHNHIAEALAKTDLSGTEFRLLWHLLRVTYGWQRKEAEISYQEFATATNTSRNNATKYLNRLQEYNIIIAKDNGPRAAKTWSFNKYVEQWFDAPIPLQEDSGIPPQGDKPIPLQEDTPIPPQGDTYKDSIKDINTGESSPPMPRLHIQEHTKHLATIAALNAELPAKTRVPYVDPIANYMGVKSLIDNGDDRWLIKVHNLAVWAHSMGIQVSDFRSWWSKWKKDYRSEGATEDQFKQFCSQRMDERKQPFMRPQVSVIAGKAIDYPFST